jgi:hypothetical protein
MELLVFKSTFERVQAKIILPGMLEIIPTRNEEEDLTNGRGRFTQQ